jgi:HTH-type transcriptional regulator / antitoxin MqsA
MEQMKAFKYEVNAELTDATFIRATRVKLGLNQHQAAQLFGGGNNGFSRYESAETQPTLPLIRLFKLLNKHPELLDEIKADQR